MEKEVIVRRPPNSHFYPLSHSIVLEGVLLYHKGVIISQACEKGICGLHRTLKGEGGRRKRGVSTVNLRVGGRGLLWGRIAKDLLKLFLDWTLSQRWMGAGIFCANNR